MGNHDLLAGRVAIVTGGGGDIGGAIARLFAAEGAAIVVADIRRDHAKRVADDVVRAKGRAIAIEADVATPAGAQRCVRSALDAFGKLTTLVNVAATVTPDGTVETLSLDDWNQAFAVNLTAAFLTCKHAVPEIRAAGGGVIVNIASQLGQIGVPGRSPYATSKAALIQFTKCLAVDHAKDGIRANSISPGVVNTARLLGRYGTPEEIERNRGPYHLLGRTGRPNEIAAGALFLASEQSAFMTGADLLLDGGYLAFKGVLSAQGEPTA
jgi:NAD(P)-dependent dehydrogenase (short-subunit alcohol dehydrogenase family)